MIRIMLCALALALVSISGANAQEKAPAPVKPIAGHAMKALGAYGYDLVELFPGGSKNPNDGALVMGDVHYRAEYKETTFLFSSADTKAAFEKDPERYLPAAGGYCLLGLHRRATGAPHRGDMPPVGDPAARTFAEGQWFFHGGIEAEREFEKDPDTINKRALEALAYYHERLAGREWRVSGK